MAKQLIIKGIEKCGNCPNVWHDHLASGDWYCRANSDYKRIPSYKTIAPFCPLPEDEA